MLDALRVLVSNKRIAVVGNSEAILSTKSASAIDGHDLVVRMNIGLPGLHASVGKRVAREAVGYRTDIWATARYWPIPVPDECKGILWMKLTKLGKEELTSMVDSKPHCQVWLWPQELEDQCKQFVGADPGTGIRLLWWLKKWASPSEVTPFGFDCWATKSHWSGQRQTKNHVPEKERAAMTALGF